ncbi:MAG: hypothetical protein GX452_13685 [Ignavibacteriales bacterium]|nr:hypothetical protein [Ignavibacteriales bacterium]
MIGKVKYFVKSMIDGFIAEHPVQPKFLFYTSFGVAAVFGAVAGILYLMSRATRTTYNQMNIIVYYAVIPFSWCWMLDSVFGFHYLKIVCGMFFVIVFFSVKDFRRFCDRMFAKSVAFLNYFNRWGSDYVLSSVVICVVLPGMVYAVLGWLMVFN